MICSYSEQAEVNGNDDNIAFYSAFSERENTTAGQMQVEKSPIRPQLWLYVNIVLFSTQRVFCFQASM